MTELHQIYRRLHMLLRYVLGISTNIQVQEPASEQGSASSSVRDERNMGMPPCFEELMQESYASNGEPSAHVRKMHTRSKRYVCVCLHIHTHTLVINV